MRSKKLEAIFLRRFQAKVIDIYNEACEDGITHDVKLEELFGRKKDHDAIIRGIVERLRAIAGDLFSRGTTA